MKQPNLGGTQNISALSLDINARNQFAREATPKEFGSEDKPLYTGRYLVTFNKQETGQREQRQFLQQTVGLNVANTAEFENYDAASYLGDADALIYHEMGVALIDGENPEQIQMLAEKATPGMTIEPELVVYVPDDIPVGINSASSWSVRATRADQNKYTGKNIKIAVLDTGFDLMHPDFAGRNITSQSFVPGEAVQDGHGHGTHCIGISCGNTDMAGLRYGIATGADIFAGKVLNNTGRGAQQWILDGIQWAINNKCRIISMSLGSPVFPGQGANPAYEQAAAYAMAQGSMIIAAAGNDSQRSRQLYRPVGSPANCPSVIAVAALDKNLDVADFSNRGINAAIRGGTVDIAAPGVNIYSSWPMGLRYRSISGTSMATPCVAGIAALIWEANPGFTNAQVISQLYAQAQRLNLPAIDVGAGLSIA